MKKFSLSLLVGIISLTFGTNGYAQLQMLRDVGSGAPVTGNPYPEVKGSPYIGDFEPGKIIFSEKDTAVNIPVAFNGFNQTLVFRDGNKLIAYEPHAITGFILNSEASPALYRSGYNLPGLGKGRFVEVLVDGEYTLVNHKHKVMVDDPGATYGSQRAKAFQSAEDLYVFKNGEPKQWKTRKKQLQELFGDDYSRVNRIQNEYNLDFRDTKDVRRLIMFLNMDNGN